MLSPQILQPVGQLLELRSGNQTQSLVTSAHFLHRSLLGPLCHSCENVSFSLAEAGVGFKPGLKQGLATQFHNTPASLGLSFLIGTRELDRVIFTAPPSSRMLETICAQGKVISLPDFFY